MEAETEKNIDDTQILFVELSEKYEPPPGKPFTYVVLSGGGKNNITPS
jgi:hypothetical protein